MHLIYCHDVNDNLKAVDPGTKILDGGLQNTFMSVYLSFVLRYVSMYVCMYILGDMHAPRFSRSVLYIVVLSF